MVHTVEWLRYEKKIKGSFKNKKKTTSSTKKGKK